jgi:hypothetical protein
MLLTPENHPFNFKAPPRLVLGLSLLLILVFLTWHLADNKRRAELDQQYIASLLKVEWPFYDTHLHEYGQSPLAKKLEAAYARKDYQAMAPQLGADREFTNAIREAQGSAADSYSQWMDSDVYLRWNSERKSYDKSVNHLSSFALGIVPQRVAFITLLSYQLVPQDLPTLITTVLLLLTAGMALELALGSGAVLACFGIGGVAGGIVFLILNGHGVFPLATPAVGTAAVMSMFLMQFRREKLVVPGGARIPAWSIGVLWLLLTGLCAWRLQLAPAVLAAIVTGLACGPLVWLAYRRWFHHEEVVIEVVAEDVDKDMVYREKLDAAFQSISRMDFAVARKQLHAFISEYPQDLRATELLYHMEKTEPSGEAFEAMAKRLFNLSNTDAAAEVCLRVYRDYGQHSKTRSALDAETTLKLVIRFIRINEVAEADNMLRKLVEHNVKHSLVQKAAASLAQAYERLQDPRKASYYREVAGT